MSRGSGKRPPSATLIDLSSLGTARADTCLRTSEDQSLLNASRIGLEAPRSPASPVLIGQSSLCKLRSHRWLVDAFSLPRRRANHGHLPRPSHPVPLTPTLRGSCELRVACAGKNLSSAAATSASNWLALDNRSHFRLRCYNMTVPESFSDLNCFMESLKYDFRGPTTGRWLRRLPSLSPHGRCRIPHAYKATVLRALDSQFVVCRPRWSSERPSRLERSTESSRVGLRVETESDTLFTFNRIVNPTPCVLVVSGSHRAQTLPT